EPLEAILRKNPRLEAALDHAASTRLQVLVSVPAPEGGWESRKSCRGDAEYIYPASAIKLSVAVAALEAVTEMRVHGTKNLATSTVLASGARRRSGPASVATLVERALVVSDNDASNDLYDFVG